MNEMQRKSMSGRRGPYREAGENFSVQLSNAVGAPIEDGSATVTILNDD
jgi:hypothetical protein